MIDYQSIIDELKDENVFNLLDKLGGQPQDKGDYILSKTICHHDNPDEASYKLYYYKNTHIFNCYSEDGTMSIFKLLKLYYETRQIDYNWYDDIYKVILDCSSFNASFSGFERYRSQRDDYTEKKNRKDLPEYSSGVLDCFVKYYTSEWLNDSITSAAMDKYNILYSISQNKIIIPHYDINNRLVGIRGRALNQFEIENIGKYAPIWIEGKCYSHPLSLNLYGLNSNWQNIKDNRICYIYESEKAVLQAENFDMPNCGVAACGSNINKFQIDLLIRYCHPYEIIICFDNEEINKSDKYFNKLYSMCSKYKNYCNISFVYDREQKTEYKDSPTDRGQEIFKQLVNRRVVVK